MMRFVALFVLVLGLVSVAVVVGATDCGTCDSLGYMCIGSQRRIDLCGHVLKAKDCPIPDCNTYCQATGQAPVGASGAYCNNTDNDCVCTPPPQPPPPPPPHAPPTPGFATTAGCTPLTCAALAQGLTCIPSNKTDPCTDLVVLPTFCPKQLPLCYIQCNPTTYGRLKLKQRDAYTCSEDGKSCLCGAAGADVGVSDTPGTHAASGPGVTVATAGEGVLDLTNFTALNPNGSITSGDGMLIGFGIDCGLGIGIVVAIVVHFTTQKWQYHGSTVNEAILETERGDLLTKGLHTPVPFAAEAEGAVGRAVWKGM